MEILSFWDVNVPIKFCYRTRWNNLLINLIYSWGMSGGNIHWSGLEAWLSEGMGWGGGVVCWLDLDLFYILTLRGYIKNFGLKKSPNPNYPQWIYWNPGIQSSSQHVVWEF